MIECMFDGCKSPRYARDLCRSHYYKASRRERGLKKRGTPKRPAEAIGYSSSHKRTAELWGPASAHSCVKCGEQAKYWAYDGTDPNQKLWVRQRGEGLTSSWYSVWPEFYMPMCGPHHSALDARELLEYRLWRQATGLRLGVSA